MEAVCKYLVSHRQNKADNLDRILAEPIMQITLKFKWCQNKNLERLISHGLHTRKQTNKWLFSTKRTN